MKLKLNKENPVSIICSEIRNIYKKILGSRHGEIAPKYEAFLKSLFPRYPAQEKQLLNEDQVVSMLIELASNEAILSRHYSGWSPHL